MELNSFVTKILVETSENQHAMCSPDMVYCVACMQSLGFQYTLILLHGESIVILAGLFDEFLTSRCITYVSIVLMSVQVHSDKHTQTHTT